MPVHIENLSSDVTVLDGDLPLTEAQLDKLVSLILRRLERKQREAQLTRAATTVREDLGPASPIHD